MSVKKSDKPDHKRSAIVMYYLDRYTKRINNERSILMESPMDPIRQSRYKLATKMLYRELKEDLTDICGLSEPAISAMYSEMEPALQPIEPTETELQTMIKIGMKLDPIIKEILYKYLD